MMAKKDRVYFGIVVVAGAASFSMEWWPNVNVCAVIEMAFRRIYYDRNEYKQNKTKRKKRTHTRRQTTAVVECDEDKNTMISV